MQQEEDVVIEKVVNTGVGFQWVKEFIPPYPTQESIDSLGPERWVDNFIINHVMYTMLQKSGKGNVKILPSEFMYYLNKKEVEEKPERPPNESYYCIPINVPLGDSLSGAKHWILAIVRFLSTSVKIDIYDSLPASDNFVKEAVGVLIMWLRQGWSSNEVINIHNSTQNDGFQCGVWVLKRFHQFLFAPQMLRSWVEAGVIQEMRLELFNEYRVLLRAVETATKRSKVEKLKVVQPVNLARVNDDPYIIRLRQWSMDPGKSELASYVVLSFAWSGDIKSFREMYMEKITAVSNIEEYNILVKEINKMITDFDQSFNIIMNKIESGVVLKEKTEWAENTELDKVLASDLSYVQKQIELISARYKNFKLNSNALTKMIDQKRESLSAPKVSPITTLIPPQPNVVENRWKKILECISTMDARLGVNGRDIKEYLPTDDESFVNVFKHEYNLRVNENTYDNNHIIKIRRNILDGFKGVRAIAKALASNDVHRLLTLADRQIYYHTEINFTNVVSNLPRRNEKNLEFKNQWDVNLINPSEALIIAVYYNSYYCVLGLLKLFKDSKLLEPLDLFYKEATALKYAAEHGCYECLLIMLKPFNWKIELILKKGRPDDGRKSWYLSTTKMQYGKEIDKTGLTLDYVSEVLILLENRVEIIQYRKELLIECLKIVKRAKLRKRKI